MIAQKIKNTTHTLNIKKKNKRKTLINLFDFPCLFDYAKFFEKNRCQRFLQMTVKNRYNKEKHYEQQMMANRLGDPVGKFLSPQCLHRRKIIDIHYFFDDLVTLVRISRLYFNQIKRET